MKEVQLIEATEWWRNRSSERKEQMKLERQVKAGPRSSSKKTTEPEERPEAIEQPLVLNIIPNPPCSRIPTAQTTKPFQSRTIVPSSKPISRFNSLIAWPLPTRSPPDASSPDRRSILL